jgi:hypothetical protein
MSKLTEIREKQAKLVADARAKYEEIADDTPPARAKELEAEYDRIMDEHDRLEGRAKKEQALAEREAALEAGDPRRPRGEDRSVVPAADPENRASSEEQRVAGPHPHSSAATHRHADADRALERAPRDRGGRPDPRRGAVRL